jgi:hypothetical protein
MCGRFRHVLYITDERHDEARMEKLRGCRDAFTAVQGADVREMVFDPEREKNIGDVGDRIRWGSTWPDAIVCASELMCFKVLLALSEKRAKIPWSAATARPRPCSLRRTSPPSAPRCRRSAAHRWCCWKVEFCPAKRRCIAAWR